MGRVICHMMMAAVPIFLRFKTLSGSATATALDLFVPLLDIKKVQTSILRN